MAVLLLDRGWAVSALPGETPTFTRDGQTITPFADLARVAQGKLTADEWQAKWAEIGLLHEDLEPHGTGTPSLPTPSQRHVNSR